MDPPTVSLLCTGSRQWFWNSEFALYIVCYTVLSPTTTQQNNIQSNLYGDNIFQVLKQRQKPSITTTVPEPLCLKQNLT